MRAYVPAYGRDDSAIRLGLSWVAAAAQAIPSAATLLIPTWKQMDSLSSVFSTSSFGAVMANRAFPHAGVPFRIVTFTTSDLPQVPTLALWADDERLARLDDRGPPAICAVPWTEDSVNKWVTS